MLAPVGESYSQLPFGQLGHHGWVYPPIDHRSQHYPSGHPQNVSGNRQFDVGALQQAWPRG